MERNTPKKNIMPKSKLYVSLDYVHWKNDKGQDHREDRPAVEHSNGFKAWYLNGKRHREDGPAIEFAEGAKHWYLNGVRYTEEDYNAKIKTLR